MGNEGALKAIIRETSIISHERTPAAIPSFRRTLRVLLAGLTALLIVGLIAPFVNAARFSGSVRGAVEESLGRKVEFDKVYFRLFPAPGFSLEDVTIQEDPSYGLEPFAYAPKLQARLRIEKLLLGQIRFASLRLVDPSLNLVKRVDGLWNVVELVERLSAPRRLPLNLFPAIEISGGRLDFKFGTRKTAFYIAQSEVSIYPERSGKVAITFSGSPARTDRAGDGFGHLHGTVNWYFNPPEALSNQLEADVTLDPSNLSEMTTLIEGHDIGVHGTVSSTTHIAGPAAALGVTGQMRFQDVHRWDLLPASGDDWKVNFNGSIDLLTHRLDLETLPPGSGGQAPVALQVKVNDFLARPAWSLLVTMQQAPLQAVLPLGKRMGLALPTGLDMSGVLDGVVGYSSVSGLGGGIAISNAVATLPQIPPLRSAVANVRILPDSIHIEPAILQAEVGGTLRAGGDYYLSSGRLSASINVDEFPVNSLVSTTQAWFGAPPALAAFAEGYITGSFLYDYQPQARAAPNPSSWSGQFEFSNATVSAQGMATPLKKAEGRMVFGPASLDVPRFKAMLGQETIAGAYRNNWGAKQPERIHLEMPSADLSDLETTLEPTLQEPGLLARLPFTKRSIPTWLAERNVEGDITIGHLSVNETGVGSLAARFNWQGTNLQVSNLQLRTPEGAIKASGSVSLAARHPRYQFLASVNRYHWGGGLISAEGRVETSGVRLEGLRNLRGSGSFSGDEIGLTPSETFATITGLFDLSFASNRPDLRLSKLQATQGDEEWTGSAASREDGKIVFDLETGERQVHLISSWTRDNKAPTPPLTSQTVAH